MVIVNLNRKGGVGKTTNTIHISSVLATMGHKVLLVDADNQCDLSGGCKVRDEELANIYNIVDFLEGNPKGKEEILTEVEKNMFLLAGSKYFDAQKYGRRALQKGLAPLKEAFDYIFIDVPPAGIITTSITPAELALFASDYYMCTIYADYFSSKNLNDFLESVDSLKEKNKLNLEFIGAYFSNVNVQTTMFRNLNNIMLSQAKEAFFESYIRRSENVVKASWLGQTIFQYNPNSDVAEDYEKLTKEMLQRIDKIEKLKTNKTI